MIVAWHEVPGTAPPQDHVRHLVTLPPVGSAAPDHTVPYGTVPSGAVFPGTSCLATISLSPRDKSHSPIETLGLQKPRSTRNKPELS
jgi:hypothetical protein